MRDIRYPLLDGDMTSTGGILIAVCELPDLHHGKQVAVEGNIATCPACKSSGPVFNDCFPDYSIDGTQILVSGARVHCGCATLPLVIQSQNDFTVEVNWRARYGIAAVEATPAPSDGGFWTTSVAQSGYGSGKTANPTLDTIEVFVFDSRYWPPDSSFGHAAIGIDDVIYSRAHSVYYKGSLTDYLRSNTRERWWDELRARWRGMNRDVVGLVMRLSSEEKGAIQDELERRVRESAPYSLTRNSCSSNVADVLEMVGILAHDPRYLATPVSPAELLGVLEKSDRLIERRFYPKGYQGGASGNW
ncbi:PAAR domain-containing protein [Cupriavidus sp. DL-D2]|uniref:PAAR domain-containing protein n=1 Tax=Cupriavidus sp. DL-D2 TaxID=3144974 RepID=UPI003215D964